MLARGSRKIPLLALALLACSGSAGNGETEEAPGWALVIHGGAGSILPENFSDEREAAFRAALATTLETGAALLREGASSLDVVEAVIRKMEDDPLFNAGRGAVFTAAGTNELDASIMDGSTTQAGGVAGVTRVRHPISAARAVMERTKHVLLAGSGAEAFAEAEGLEMVDPDYFWTEDRWRSLERAREKQRQDDAGGDAAFGTVGAVALDREGRLAAGTSTGGMTNKKHGRIGDSPIIGAGTYANAGCGISATGHGEFFIRFAVAFDICARMRSGEATLQEAADQVIHGVLREAGGEGGIIGLDADGRPALVFNTDGMYRGYLLAGGEPQVAMFKNN